MSTPDNRMARNIHVTRTGTVINVSALIDDVNVNASFDILQLIHDLGHVPSVQEFWHTHVAALLHSSFVMQELETLGLDSPPDNITVPTTPNDSPIEPVDVSASGPTAVSVPPSVVVGDTADSTGEHVVPTPTADPVSGPVPVSVPTADPVSPTVTDSPTTVQTDSTATAPAPSQPETVVDPATGVVTVTNQGVSANDGATANDPGTGTDAGTDAGTGNPKG